WSLPFERPFLPLIDEADGQHAEEYDHRPEAEKADLAERHRPGKQEGDFEVEDDEQDRYEIEAHVELAARIGKGIKAALVGRQLLGVRILPCDHHGGDHE